jgi:galactose mutarotase-like enzyme
MESVTIQNKALTVRISPVGAEIQSILDANGVERLWQGDPAFWGGRAPILFPVAGGFKDDGYLLDGKRYPMPKHGFVRKLPWRVVTQTADTATFAISEKHEGFPFDYELRAHYTLLGDTLTVRYEALNLGDTTFWYSVGSHEGYATPEGIDRYELVFDQAETFLHSPLEGNLIRRETVTIAENTAVLPLTYDYFTVDALVLRTLKSRGVTLRSKLHNRTVRVEYPGCDVLMLWTKPGAGYLCIEPWCNAPDFVDAHERIDQKPGFMALSPGDARSHTHTVTVG